MKLFFWYKQKAKRNESEWENSVIFLLLRYSEIVQRHWVEIRNDKWTSLEWKWPQSPFIIFITNIIQCLKWDGVRWDEKHDPHPQFEVDFLASSQSPSLPHPPLTRGFRVSLSSLEDIALALRINQNKLSVLTCVTNT